MIFHDKKLIFIHIRKNAGSFFYATLGEKNSSFSDGLIGCDWLFRSRYPDYITVAIVRNPWDRFISGWRYCRSTRKRSLKEVLKNLPSDNPAQQLLFKWPDTASGKFALFEELVYRGVFETIRRKIKRLPSRHKRLAHDFRHITCQQTDFIMNKDKKFVVDYLIRFESLEHDLENLLSGIGCSSHLADGHTPINQNPVRIDYRDIFSSEDKKRFYELFDQDVELLGYEFDNGPGVPPTLCRAQTISQQVCSSS